MKSLIFSSLLFTVNKHIHTQPILKTHKKQLINDNDPVEFSFYSSRVFELLLLEMEFLQKIPLN